LAEGQSRRVAEIRDAVKNLENLSFEPNEKPDSVVLGSLVQMEQDSAKQHWFFIAPAAGGYRCQITEHEELANITVITPQSPMGSALLSKALDDEVILSIGKNRTCDFIVEIK
jgi:transcription elongation GreA/GreB family factor